MSYEPLISMQEGGDKMVVKSGGEIEVQSGGAFDLQDGASMPFGTGSDVVLKWNGTYLEGGPAAGMWAGCPSRADANFEAVATYFFDDFQYQNAVDANLRWVEASDGGTGTNLINDSANGTMSIVCAAADNDYHVIHSVAESWLFASGKKMWFEAKLALTELNTSTASWWVGFTDLPTHAATTGGFQADAAGPLASYDGALIYKAEDLVVKSEASNAGTQTADATLGTAVSGTSHTVGFYFDGVATTSTITPYFDGTAGTAHNITLSGLQEMHMVLGCKAGSADAEALVVDYVKCIQLR